MTAVIAVLLAAILVVLVVVARKALWYLRLIGTEVEHICNNTGGGAVVADNAEAR